MVQYLDTAHNSIRDVICPTCRESLTHVHPSFAIRKLVISLHKNLPKVPLPPFHSNPQISPDQQRNIDTHLAQSFAARTKEAKNYHRIVHQNQQRRQQDLQDSSLIIKLVSVLIILIIATWYFVLTSQTIKYFNFVMCCLY